MSKRRLAPEDQKIVVAARVSRSDQALLERVGDGNISLGINRIVTFWTSEKSVAEEFSAPSTATLPPACT